jgi:hypothetical protein
MAALTYRRTTVDRFSRRCAVCATVLLLALAACGGDDEPDATSGASTASPDTAGSTESAGPRTDTATAPAQPPATSTSPSPEDQTGGAGDEVAAESQALLTGRGGRITPRVVRVPAFISIRVELRSADGAPYVLRFGRRTLAVRTELPSISHRFAGLRPGDALIGESAEGTGNTVRIEATAEPGP